METWNRATYNPGPKNLKHSILVKVKPDGSILKALTKINKYIKIIILIKSISK